eukprot:975266_1
MSETLKDDVRDFLEFYSFSETAKQFAVDCQKVVAERIRTTPLILQRFDDGDAAEFMKLWSEHIDENDRVGKKLLFYVNIYFAVRPLFEAQSDDPDVLKESMRKFRGFLETRGVDLAQTTEFLPFYALPFVPSPAQHPSFQTLFEPRFAGEVRERLAKFLKSAIPQPKRPKLEEIYEKYSEMEANQSEESGRALKISESADRAVCSFSALLDHVASDLTPSGRLRVGGSYRAAVDRARADMHDLAQCAGVALPSGNERVRASMSRSCVEYSGNNASHDHSSVYHPNNEQRSMTPPGDTHRRSSGVNGHNLSIDECNSTISDEHSPAPHERVSATHAHVPAAHEHGLSSDEHDPQEQSARPGETDVLIESQLEDEEGEAEVEAEGFAVDVMDGGHPEYTEEEPEPESGEMSPYLLVRGDLDFEWIRRDLVEGSPELSASLLQSLRFRLSRVPSPIRRRTLKQFVDADLLGEARGTNVFAHVCAHAHPLVAESAARLLNAMASFVGGRRYLGARVAVIAELFAVLRAQSRDTPIRQQMLGALQKFSLRTRHTRDMIEIGIIEWIVEILSDPSTLSAYTIEYASALLMNLALKSFGRRACVSMASQIVDILRSLPECGLEQVRTYANGAFYALVTVSAFRVCVREAGLEREWRATVSEDGAESQYARQVKFILERLESSEEEEVAGIESDEGADSSESEMSDGIDDEAYGDDDELQERVPVEQLRQEELLSRYALPVHEGSPLAKSSARRKSNTARVRRTRESPGGGSRKAGGGSRKQSSHLSVNSGAHKIDSDAPLQRPVTPRTDLTNGRLRTIKLNSGKHSVRRSSAQPANRTQPSTAGRPARHSQSASRATRNTSHAPRGIKKAGAFSKHDRIARTPPPPTEAE